MVTAYKQNRLERTKSEELPLKSLEWLFLAEKKDVSATFVIIEDDKKMAPGKDDAFAVFRYTTAVLAGLLLRSSPFTEIQRRTQCTEVKNKNFIETC